jgi:hypothetical protein
LLAKNNDEQTLLHVAADRYSTELFERAWAWAERKLNPVEVHNELLLAKNRRKESVWHILVKESYWARGLLKKLWHWATETLPPQEIKNIFLARDDDEHSVLRGGKSTRQRVI